MPDETKPSGLLVDPMGHDAKVLTDKESVTLRAILTMLRDDVEPLHELIQHLVIGYKASRSRMCFDRDSLAQFVIFHYLGTGETANGNDGGLLSNGSQEDMEPECLDKYEFTTLRNTLKVLRLGGWFADWLDTQVDAIVNAKLPEEKHPSPMLIAQSLTLAVSEWQERLEAATEVAQERPDLLPAPAVEPEAPPAKPVIVPKASKPAKAKRTRRATKKAA